MTDYAVTYRTVLDLTVGTVPRSYVMPVYAVSAVIHRYPSPLHTLRTATGCRYRNNQLSRSGVRHVADTRPVSVDNSDH